jgi:cytochrome d ubiquinol oxidase subunit II
MEFDYGVLWFFLLGILLAGYAILDGFDLGVGILHLVARKDRERRIIINSIGPLWDGNEVWLVTFGGALFAAFPLVYAQVFSAFYVPFMLLLFALIFRAVSMEFRSKLDAPWWRSLWDFGFFLSSFVATLLFGVAVGNAKVGLKLDENFEYVGTLWDMLTPYPIAVGLLAVATFAMHGSIYLYLKTEGELQERIHGWMWHCFGLFLIMFILVTMFTLALMPESTQPMKDLPILWAVPVLMVLAVANIPRAIFMNRPLYAFISSCCTIAALVFLFGVSLFPNVAVSSIDSANNLTIHNAGASDKTYFWMTLFAVIGMPLVLTYTGIVYWTFRGKVEMGKFSY